MLVLVDLILKLDKVILEGLELLLLLGLFLIEQDLYSLNVLLDELLFIVLFLVEPLFERRPFLRQNLQPIGLRRF